MLRRTHLVRPTRSLCLRILPITPIMLVVHALVILMADVANSTLFADLLHGVVALRALYLAAISWTGVLDLIIPPSAHRSLNDLWMMIFISISFPAPASSIWLLLVMIGLCNATATAWLDTSDRIYRMGIVVCAYIMNFLSLVGLVSVLGLCGALDEGLCEPHFRHSFPTTARYYIGLLLLNSIQDVLSGRLLIWPDAFWRRARAFRGVYGLLCIGLLATDDRKAVRDVLFSLSTQVFESLKILELVPPLKEQSSSIPEIIVRLSSLPRAFGWLPAMVAVILASTTGAPLTRVDFIKYTLLMILLVCSFCSAMFNPTAPESFMTCHGGVLSSFAATVVGMGCSVAAGTIIWEGAGSGVLFLAEVMLVGLVVISHTQHTINDMYRSGPFQLAPFEELVLLVFVLMLVTSVFRLNHSHRWTKWPLVYFCMQVGMCLILSVAMFSVMATVHIYSTPAEAWGVHQRRGAFLEAMRALE